MLHKDSITLYDDLHGLSTVKGYFQVGFAKRHVVTHYLEKPDVMTTTHLIFCCVRLPEAVMQQSLQFLVVYPSVVVSIGTDDAMLKQAYLDKYKYDHHVICGAVDEPSNVAFSMHQDKVLCGTCLLQLLKAYS